MQQNTAFLKADQLIFNEKTGGKNEKSIFVIIILSSSYDCTYRVR